MCVRFYANQRLAAPALLVIDCRLLHSLSTRFVIVNLLSHPLAAPIWQHFRVFRKVLLFRSRQESYGILKLIG
jgi:hypothetical protein